MKPLAELMERSMIAVRFYDLICIALYSTSPSTAYEVASGLGWRERQAASCRFLSVMLRDYGLNKTMRFVNAENAEAYENVCICECHVRQYPADYFFSLDDECGCDCCSHNECLHAAHAFNYDCPNCDTENQQDEEDEGDESQPDCSQCSCQECDGYACDSCSYERDQDCEGYCACYGCSDKDYCENCPSYEPEEDTAEENAPDVSRDAETETVETVSKGPKTIEERVQWICDRIQEVTGTNYPLSIARSDEVNAYADGDSISINTGMLETFNDDELAWVIGHEVVHNKDEHLKEGRKRTNETIANARARLHGPRGLILNVLSATAGGFVDHFFHKAANRREEMIADLKAKRIMAEAGFDPDGARSALLKLNDSGGGAFADHPMRVIRLMNLEDR